MDVRTYQLWTALITPLMPDRALDIAGLFNLIDEQDRIGAGLLLLGSTGEGLNLGLSLKKRLLEQSLTRAQGPIMVGVFGHDLEETLSWLRYLETLPIHAYLMPTPIYARPGDEGQYHWFSTLMDRVSRPVMLYNVPKRCGTSLSLAAVERLAHHSNYWAIKDASGSVSHGAEYLRASTSKPVFCGDDALFPAFWRAGSCGLVSVTANVWPKATKLVVELAKACAFAREDLWQEACNELFRATNPIAVKRLLFEQRRINAPTLMPPLSPLDFSNSENLLAVSEKIDQWVKQFS